MAQGSVLSDWEIEAIRAAFAESGNMSYAAMQANVTYTAVRKYCKEFWNEISELRAKQKEDVIRDFYLLRRMAISELMTPTRLKKATTHELLVMTGIITDKINNLEGNPTSRLHITHGQRDKELSAGSLTPEERERARALRERMLGTPDGAENIIEAAGSIK